MKRLLFVCMLSTGLCGCSQSVTVPERDADFMLFVDVTPRKAIIVVDDTAVGTGQTSATVPLRIRAGTRRIAIVHEGYYTFRTTLEYIQPGETYTLKAHLIASEF